MTIRRTIGGYVTASPVLPAGPYRADAADGVWSLSEQLQYSSGGTWPTAGNTRIYIAVTYDTPPYVAAYPWSGSGFGTKYANPATLPTDSGTAVAFSPAGNSIAVAHFATPFISTYPWSVSGFGTKYSDPATLPTGNSRSVAFGAI